MADVFEFDGLTVQHNFLLRDRLKITGEVRSGPEGIAGAVVTLLEGTGSPEIKSPRMLQSPSWLPECKRQL